jgi:Mg/Co/Ni transporter MgtE
MHDIPVRRFMSTTLVIVRPDDTFDSAAKLMETRRVHHVLVIDGAALVGILSSADLLKVALLRRAGPTDTPAGQDSAERSRRLSAFGTERAAACPPAARRAARP